MWQNVQKVPKFSFISLHYYSDKYMPTAAGFHIWTGLSASVSVAQVHGTGHIIA